MKVEIDPDCDKNYPPKESVKLTVRTKAGKTYELFEEDLTYADDKFVVDRFYLLWERGFERKRHLDPRRKDKQYRKSKKRRGNYFFARQAKKQIGTLT